MEGMNINWLAIVAAAILPLVTGFLWYGPLFGKAWMKESGMTEEKAKSMNPAKTYGIAVILAFFIAFSIWPLVFMGGGPDMPHGVDPYLTFKHGALHGAMLGLFVAVPVLGINSLFEQKSFKYMLINGGYWVVTMALMGGIVNAWV